MHEPVHRTSADDGAAADARADRDVDERIDAASGAPAILRQRGAVDAGARDDRVDQWAYAAAAGTRSEGLPGSSGDG